MSSIGNTDSIINPVRFYYNKTNILNKQNFRSKKNEITKKIKIKTDFEVDYENMIVNQNFD